MRVARRFDGGCTAFARQVPEARSRLPQTFSVGPAAVPMGLSMLLFSPASELAGCTQPRRTALVPSQNRRRFPIGKHVALCIVSSQWTQAIFNFAIRAVLVIFPLLVT